MVSVREIDACDVVDMDDIIGFAGTRNDSERIVFTSRSYTAIEKVVAVEKNTSIASCLD